MEDIEEEDYVDEECICKCAPKPCDCKCECDDCDKDWEPGIDTCDEESDYDSDDSMDDIYEDCGLSRKEKKQLQDELNYLIKRAETCCPNCEDKSPTYTPEVPEANHQQK